MHIHFWFLTSSDCCSTRPYGFLCWLANLEELYAALNLDYWVLAWQMLIPYVWKYWYGTPCLHQLVYLENSELLGKRSAFVKMPKNHQAVMSQKSQLLQQLFHSQKAGFLATNWKCQKAKSHLKSQPKHPLSSYNSVSVPDLILNLARPVHRCGCAHSHHACSQE